MRVSWVHPTWRDLVIEDLARDAAARRRFLDRCELHGALLALSAAGGVEGERRLPLLVTDADWDALADRLYALIPLLEPAQRAAILTAIRLALGELDSAAGAIGEARSLAGLALTRCAADWSDRTVLPISVLDSWLRLCKALASDVPLPSLGATWAELLPARAPDPADRIAVQRFTDWLVLCEVLSDFSFDLLRSLGYGHEHAMLCVEFLDSVACCDPGHRSDDHVVGALQAIAADSAELRDRALGLVAGAWRQALRPETVPRVQEWAGAGDGFDVARVLADL